MNPGRPLVHGSFRVNERTVALLGALAIVEPTTAQAQAATYSAPRVAVIPVQRMSEADRARATMNDYAKCLVTNRPGLAKQAAELPDDARAVRALNRLAISDCLYSGGLVMPHEVLRGAIYTALYKRDYLRSYPPAKSVAIDYMAGNAGSSTAARNWATIRMFASCVSRMDPINARAAVLARVASVEERETYTKLTPAMGDCLTAKGSVTFSKTVLQGALAEVLYREASSVAGVPVHAEKK